MSFWFWVAVFVVGLATSEFGFGGFLMGLAIIMIILSMLVEGNHSSGVDCYVDVVGNLVGSQC